MLITYSLSLAFLLLSSFYQLNSVPGLELRFRTFEFPLVHFHFFFALCLSVSQPQPLFHRLPDWPSVVFLNLSRFLMIKFLFGFPLLQFIPA